MKYLRLFWIIPISYCLILSFCTENRRNDYEIPIYPRIFPRTMTVGGPEADIIGFTSEAIQEAIDTLSAHGGGSVKLTRGIFEVMTSVRLKSHIALIGSDYKTVLRKSDGVRTKIICDVDSGATEVSVADASGFKPRMGMQISFPSDSTCWGANTAIITDVEDHTIRFDKPLKNSFHVDLDAEVSNSCAVVSAEGAENIVVCNLRIDGNKTTNLRMTGCRGGGIHFYKVKNALIENVIVSDWNGDGISWQRTEHVAVRYCEVKNCTEKGLHPGGGSPYTLIEGNNSHYNGLDGLYVCWRVTGGLVRNNQFHHNERFGICTGYRDNDMVFVNNHIYENGKTGVNFREEEEKNIPHRNTFYKNVVENNGTEKDGGYGFLFSGEVDDILIQENIIRDRRGGRQKAAVSMFRKGLSVVLKNNKISGHKKGEVVIGDFVE